MCFFSKVIVSASVAALLSACGTTGSQYRPIVDGDKHSHYEVDLVTCSSLSRERRYTNDDVKSEALLGAAVGAVAGAIDDGSDGALGGAIVGGVLGGGGRAWETREERKRIVIECMKQRGHRVVG
ncbi:MAG: glycine zipper family protein [Candidatus Thiodiazotropha sp. (ex Dulcina madagascariensis)]|nr:glycine zipper family protein [Candidatus Thiodiazotropha sp. (ex Epidulcina cf. delphinae)]MCU7922025.1 glycine zipper family protein [Candidatus Thiodiazotropha sp. (ex Dulcina madagascariensis)]MCU7927729.1 glycine zipper family protein [Candidatus Thiodiazotropha sp. (ex Dulcina madagascariensis)]